jgi:AcrR family transcriptional regulator
MGDNGRKSRRPGPAPEVTRELLLDAGRKCFKKAEQQPKLAEVMGLRLADVLAECAVLLSVEGSPPRRTVAPAVLYKHWPDGFEAYLQDLIRLTYHGGRLDTSALTTPGTLSERLGRHAAADREQLEGDESAPRYFGLFRGVEDDEVLSSLRAVYASYDAQVMPALRDVLESAHRRPRASVGGIEAITAALTAVAEGLVLRGLVSPEVRDLPNDLWSAVYVGIVDALTEPLPA